MIVYATSDLHGNLPPIPEDADLLLVGGDICPDFRPYGRHAVMSIDTGGTQQARWLDEEFRAWLESAIPRDCQVVGIAGNHDFVFEKPFLVPRDLPWTYLKDSLAPLEAAGGLRVWGTPWVPGLPYWAFYGREEALSARADLIPEGLDVLMTHGPPYGAGDYIPTSEKQRNKYGNFGGEHVGDPSLVPIIKERAPKVVVCGHIHEARGVHALPDSPSDWDPIYNVAAVNEVYELHKQPFTRLYEFG